MNKLTIKFHTDEGKKVIENMEKSFEPGGKDAQGYFFRDHMAEIRYTIETANVFYTPAKETIFFHISGIHADDVVKSYQDLIMFLKTQKQPYRWAENFNELFK